MSVSLPYINLINARTYATNAAITTDAYVPHPAAQQTSFYTLATTAGSLNIQAQLMNGTWITMVTTAVVANTPLRSDYVAPAKALRAMFTPSANPGTVTVDAGYNGHGQPS